MKKMIAYCGLVCSDCPTYLATKNNDDAARTKTTAFYAEAYGFDLKPEDINCDGCLSKGEKLIAYCDIGQTVHQGLSLKSCAFKLCLLLKFS